MPTIRSTPSIVVLAAVALVGCASGMWYDGLDSDQLYAYASEKYAEEEWSDAIEGYERLLATAPGYERANDARFFLATAFHRNGDHLSAASEFIRILNRGGADTLMAASALGVCHAYAARSPIPARDQTYTHQAITSCDEVVRDYPGFPASDTAAVLVTSLTEKLAQKDFGVGEWYLKRDLVDSAISYYQDVVDNYPQSETAPLALLKIYEAYTQIGYDDLAERAKEQLLRDYPDTDAARTVGVDGGG